MNNGLLSLIATMVFLAFAIPSQAASEDSFANSHDPTESLMLVQQAAQTAGMELQDQDLTSLLWLFEIPEQGLEGRLLALRTQALTRRLLTDISSARFNTSNLSRSQEQDLYRRVLSILIEEGERSRSSDTHAYWWPLIFLSYSLPMTVGEEARVVEQNLALLEDADAFSDDKSSKLQRLVSYHEEQKTPTYGYALVARAVGNMTLLSQGQFEKLVQTLDNNSLGMASKALKKLGLSRESFAGMNMSERALFVVDIISFIPVLNIKAQVLVFLGTFTYRNLHKILEKTGTDKLLQGLTQKYVEQFGLDQFESNYPALHSMGQTAQAALTAAGNLGRGTLRVAQAATVSVLDSTAAAKISSGVGRVGDSCRSLFSRKPSEPQVIEHSDDGL